MERPPLKDTNNTTGLIPLGSIPGLAPVASFNEAQIESLIQTKGFDAFHYPSAPLPNRQTMEGAPNPNQTETNLGRRYFDVRKIKLVPYSMPMEQKIQIMGVYGMGSIFMNIAGHYSDRDKETVYCRTGDIIELNPTITSEVDQLIEYNPSGINTLNFKAKSVKYLASETKIYTADEDFTLVDGNIVWLHGGKRPSFYNGQGEVLTCVYWISPIFVVKDVPHHLRILPSNSFGNGGFPRDATYAPQLIIASQLFSREKNLLDVHSLPGYTEYPDSANTTGG